MLIFLAAFCTTVSVSLPPASLWAVSINANGLADPMKISAMNSFAQLIKPHAIVIQETQSTEHVASQLDMPGYDFIESPGHPSLAHGWVILAVKCHLFNVQSLLLPYSLKGCAVALDITIPLVTGQGFVHHFIGFYASWDPGITFDDNIQFWPVLTDLCRLAPFSWSIIGDYNATLQLTESKASPYCILLTQQLYASFLQPAGGVDCWSTITDHNVPLTTLTLLLYSLNNKSVP
ncbi:hypothetical protein L208DRAFT_1328527 [Tricholoma matsutake]|nr:hypothetical protein L208DRAFT_1328527 [Tricholoma matsutake 945]